MDLVLNATNVYQPDVFFFRHHSDARRGERCIEGTPEFVVEILSESTLDLDRIKRKIYARSGVKELWFVDPDAKNVTIFVLLKSSEHPMATHPESASFTSQIFPGLTFSGSEI